MGGRFVQQRRSARSRHLAAEPLFEDPGGHYKTSPDTRIAAVVEHPIGGVRSLHYLGLVPSWTPKDKAASNAPIQRSLRVCRRSPAFRGLLERHRLIVPADGFYEWAQRPTVRVKPSTSVGSTGARWPLEGSGRRGTIPTSPDTSMSHSGHDDPHDESQRADGPDHDRMPVVIVDGAIDAWLDPSFETRRRCAHCCVRFLRICLRRFRSVRRSATRVIMDAI